ncbi:unnamed protein product (macronuclear) [Paramecium tetraurelia]|uniref:Polyadenylate-binding protein n=1 Tax=Paramecium tetraurelia TaxID=5888 RepID=A0CA51_PARTE|nr:uncharacterized protein GSPATT00036448001 [Paramecium tetraurelia]CAK67668.1 unnamed protein product [Paramecium tetraurelia]|eukprot:XP_001435065.1 hypothetical protein (macronuclear) [Paramecium tetraurelia strain d4-2]
MGISFQNLSSLSLCINKISAKAGIASRKNQRNFKSYLLNRIQMLRFPGYQDQNKQSENGLHIADLEEGITEEQLFVEFRKFGQISFVKLHRYPFIGKSKHYAFIYFSSQEEARKAKEAMNYKQLLREPMRITYIQEYEKDANLFFAGFELTVTLKQLEEFFLKWGQVVSVKLSTDENKKSRGYGWVQYEKKEQANALLADSTDGTIAYNEKTKVIVKRFVKKGQTDREDKRNNLYIKNFWPSLENYDLDNAEVRESLEKEMREKLNEWFSGYGSIVSILVKIDVERKAPFAFVSFNRHQDAKEAQRTLGTTQKRDPLSTGRMMYVGWAQTKTDRKQQRDNNVFAKYIYADHLSRNVTEEMIRTTLKECGYGDIQTIRLEKMQQGFQQIIRIGYIVFDQASDANKLVKNFKENEKFEEIKKLFDPSVETAGGKYFQHLFPQQSQQRGQRRNNQRQSPNRRMYSMPQGPTPFGQRMPFPPYQMQQRMQGPGQMRRPFPQQIPGFTQPIRPNIPPPVQQPEAQKQAPPQAVPFNQRQDLIDLLANFETFKAKSQDEQLRQIQQMLYYRIKARLSTDTEAHWKRISEILSDPTNYTTEEIIDMFKEEEQFNSFIDEAIEQLKEASCW